MVPQTQSTDPKALPAGPPEAAEPQLRRSWSKLMVLAALLMVLLTVVYCSPLRQYLGDLRELSRRVRSFGPLAPLVLMGGVAVLVATGFPRLLFCVLSGMALGFWSGLLWAQLGTLLGNYLLFLVIRGLGREWGQRMVAKRADLKSLLEKRGALGVLLARQLPLPGLLINIACALLPVSHWDFLAGTVLGQLPQAIPCTLIGAGVLQASLGRSIGIIILAVALSILAWLTVRYFATSRAP